jgi:replicative DNA helicase
VAQSVAPPQNVEAEEMLLAALMDASVNVPDAMGIVAQDDFYKEGHRRVFGGILDLFNAGEPIEPITVIDALAKSGDLDAAGGRNGVLDLLESPYIAASYKTYAEMVRDAATQRRLLQVGQRIQAMISERVGETVEMVQETENLIYGLSQKRVRGDFTKAHDLVVRSMERLVEASERGSEVTGLATGYTDLDRLTGGLRPNNLVVVAARPSMGKTALALGMAEHAALNDGLSVAIFSLEMSGEERVSHAADRLAGARIYIDDSEGMSVAEMRTKARRLKSRDGLDLVIVDYIQLMEGTRGRRDENRVQEISAISRALKMLARDLEVPLVCVSQLNRAPDARNDKRPMLSDLRESGAIEQDADLVLMIYRDDYYNPEDSEEKGIAEVNVAKNRNGPVNRVKLAFMGNYAKFGNLARDE